MGSAIGESVREEEKLNIHQMPRDEVRISRFIPFVLKDKDKPVTDISSRFILPDWELRTLSESMPVVFSLKTKAISQMKSLNFRNFPQLIASTPLIRGSKPILDRKTNSQVNFNYLATIVLGLIYASRAEMKDVDKAKLTDFVEAANEALEGLGRLDQELINDNMLMASFYPINELMKGIVPTLTDEMREMLVSIDIPELGDSIEILRDIDLEMAQSLYFFDSRIGFLINQINIKGLRRVDRELVFSIDFLYQLCSSWFNWNEKDPEKLESVITQRDPLIESDSARFFGRYYHTITLGEKVELGNLDEKALLENPVVHILSSALKSHLLFFCIKQPRVLIAQANFRSSIRNEGAIIPRVHIGETLNYLSLLLFHEKEQLLNHHKICKSLWQAWQKSLANALKWNSREILLTGKMGHLSQLSHEESELEFFLKERYSDLNFQERMDELSNTMEFHPFIFVMKGNGSPFGDIKALKKLQENPIDEISQDLTYLEFINASKLMTVLGKNLRLDQDYQTLLYRHKSLEKMLETVYELTQTKQQRMITIALVAFSIVQFLVLATLSFLALFK